MPVMLMRHVEYADGPGRTAYLTDPGKLHADSIGRQLIERGLVPDRIYYSGREQTVETARRLARIFKEASGGKEAPLEHREWICKETCPGELLAENETVLLVVPLPNFWGLAREFGAEYNSAEVKPRHGKVFVFSELKEGTEKRDLLFQINP